MYRRKIHVCLDSIHFCVIFELLNTHEWVLAAKWHWIMEPAKLNQCLCFKSVLISKWKSKNIWLWGKGYAFISLGNERLWIHYKFLKIMFVWGKIPKNPGYMHNKINLEKLQNTIYSLFAQTYKPLNLANLYTTNSLYIY